MYAPRYFFFHPWTLEKLDPFFAAAGSYKCLETKIIGNVTEVKSVLGAFIDGVNAKVCGSEAIIKKAKDLITNYA